jgi:multisubunit Na+/H+ antiporter MnhB subunit
MASNKRKGILINPRFQTTFITFALLASVLNILIFLGSNYLFFRKFESLGKEFGIPVTSSFFTFIDRQKKIMNGIFIETALFDFILVGILGLIFSHRISGPLHRLEKFLLESSPDKLHSIKIRKGDFFPELVTALNSFIKKLNRK